MLAFYGCGIVGMLAVYGILQERIMTVRYDDEMPPAQSSVVRMRKSRL